MWLFLGLAPTLFFAFEDKNSELYIRRFGTVLLNWVLTPALLIYMAVLYVYAAKILFTWNLPKGGVSIMVGVFVGVVMLTKMLQLLVDKHPFRWFYDHFSLFALPLLVLFWTAVGRRLSDHGLTESRFYLVLCGVFMTLFVVLFLFSNKKGYFMLAAAAFAVVAAMVCIPPLSGERVAQRAQIHRVRSVDESPVTFVQEYCNIDYSKIKTCTSTVFPVFELYKRIILKARKKFAPFFTTSKDGNSRRI